MKAVGGPDAMMDVSAQFYTHFFANSIFLIHSTAAKVQPFGGSPALAWQRDWGEGRQLGRGLASGEGRQVLRATPRFRRILSLE